MPLIKTLGLFLFWIVALLTLIFLLFIVLAFGVGRRYRPSLTASARVDVEIMAMACQDYRLHAGEFPDNPDLLFEKPDNLTIEQWNGPYLVGPMNKNDDWGNAYLLEVDEADESITVRSLGPDGMKNTDDDICASKSSTRDD